MDQKYNTSFIPKKFLSEDVQSGSTSKYIKRRSIIGPGYFIAVLIFIATIGASITLFIYTGIIDSAITQKIDTLDEQMAQISQEEIDEFIDFEQQLRNIKKILDGHVAVSEVLHRLEEKTLRDVQYSGLAYYTPNTGQFPTLELSGITSILENIALQIREFENDQEFLSPVITSLVKDSESGPPTFGVRTNILHELVSYAVAVREDRHGKSTVRAQPAAPPPPSASVVPLTPQ